MGTPCADRPSLKTNFRKIHSDGFLKKADPRNRQRIFYRDFWTKKI